MCVALTVSLQQWHRLELWDLESLPEPRTLRMDFAAQSELISLAINISDESRLPATLTQVRSRGVVCLCVCVRLCASRLSSAWLCLRLCVRPLCPHVHNNTYAHTQTQTACSCVFALTASRLTCVGFVCLIAPTSLLTYVCVCVVCDVCVCVCATTG